MTEFLKLIGPSLLALDDASWNRINRSDHQFLLTLFLITEYGITGYLADIVAPDTPPLEQMSYHIAWNGQFSGLTEWNGIAKESYQEVSRDFPYINHPHLYLG